MSTIIPDPEVSSPDASNRAARPRNYAKAKRSRKPESPIIKLMKLHSKIRKQPVRLPTETQLIEMARLTWEVEKLTEYRAAHPDWRQEQRWI